MGRRFVDMRIDLLRHNRSMTETALKTPLYDSHLRLGGKMVPFAGYDMPVQYTGIIAESKAVREGAGMFDVSHMARLKFTGPGVVEFLERITANDIGKLSDGAGHYSLLPNDQGGCVDDIITYRIGEQDFRMVVNAANHAKDVAWIQSQSHPNVGIEDYTDQTAMIAVQGPKALSIVQALSDRPEELAAAPMFGVVNTTIAGVPCFAARSGYTGEDGFEIICLNEVADAVWNSLLQAGVTPCGLGSRDVLRVEAGLPLYGHELGDDINPISAGLGWVIKKDKEFVGSEPINQARASGTAKKLHGIRLETKRLPMPGMQVFVEGKGVGEVSSGVYSPMLDCGIGFAFVDAAVKLETPCAVDIRGKMEPGTIVSKRFFKRD